MKRGAASDLNDDQDPPLPPSCSSVLAHPSQAAKMLENCMEA